MMKLLFSVIAILIYQICIAQELYSIKGTVADSSLNADLPDVSVSLLRAKDSILVSFIRTEKNGAFNFAGLKQGKYLLLITYPDYADYTENIELDLTQPSKKFNRINLTLRSRLLEEVIVRSKTASVRIKGDTTEYNAKNYVITPNSKVEDLLKQLPGLEVDRNGQIKAQGVTVTRVLVDGEQFFGDDPTLVTQNIRGDMVDKIQVFDKKSDIAVLTGIDDGVKSKTINVKLKADKKNGYFGKIEAGGASGGYYQQQGMFNYFTARQKFSIFQTFNNIGRTGLGPSDSFKYGFSNTNSYFNASNFLILPSPGTDNSESWDGRYSGEGIPETKLLDVNYDTRLNNNKNVLNINYKIGSLKIRGNRQTTSYNNLPAGLLTTNTESDIENYGFRQTLDGTYTAQLDTTAVLKTTFSGALKNFDSDNSFRSANRGISGDLLNENSRMLNNNGNEGAFNLNMTWTKALKKKGRSLTLGIFENFFKYSSAGKLNSITNFYSIGKSKL
jgi:hypothetical protein